ncbi:MAG TPA: hypothetical protein VN943_07500 [Candidatus Acidoferrum sp.]|nr:hypothetical protein [Candidatus Acidoferrum sp.]
MTALLLDLALSRRVELAEAQAAADAAETMEKLRPGSGAAVEQTAGGYAVYCGANSPVTQAVGLGLDGTVSEEEFARLEEFYRSRNEPVRVETSPLADASLFEQFGQRAYRASRVYQRDGSPAPRGGFGESGSISRYRDHRATNRARTSRLVDAYGGAGLCGESSRYA